MRLIDDQGENIGLMPIEKALNIAREKSLDLVEISSNINPAIVRICDFGKFLYQKEKELKKQRASQKGDEMKSVRLTFGIGKHDLEFKARQAEEFLNQFSKIQIELILRGRQKGRRDYARTKIEEFLKMINFPFKIIQEPKGTPRSLNLIIGK